MKKYAFAQVSLILFTLLFSSLGYSSELEKRNELFNNLFYSSYRPGYCGLNIKNLLVQANTNHININKSVVLKFVGAGFFETSGFYTRGKVNERAMLGYFHMVLLADGYIYDFDLNEPLVLKLEDYIRLQFSPPNDNYKLFGVIYNAQSQLNYWTVTAYDPIGYARGQHNLLWTKNLNQLVDIESLFNSPRIR
jgi:hypothetical protein